MNWQPIDTAPKNGTEILICGGSYWSQCSPLEFPSKPFNGVTAAYCLYEGDWFWSGDICHEPTHWMPLPKPPEQE